MIVIILILPKSMKDNDYTIHRLGFIPLIHEFFVVRKKTNKIIHKDVHCETNMKHCDTITTTRGRGWGVERVNSGMEIK